MQNLLWTLLLGCLLIQAGCKTQQEHPGPRPKVFVVDTKVFVIHTTDGRGHVVSAPIREDGQFNNSITIDGITQTLSGQVTKTDDEYLVTVDYTSTQSDAPGHRQVRSTVSLKEGESKNIGGAIGGVSNDVVSVMISK